MWLTILQTRIPAQRLRRISRKAFRRRKHGTQQYTYFASVARKNGFEQIAAIFEHTAANEKEHAKLWCKAPAVSVRTRPQNLQHAAEGEKPEWTDMYDRFAKDADAEVISRSCKNSSAEWQLQREDP